MPTRNERVQIVIGAKDKASPILKRVQGAVVGIGTAYLGWQTAKAVIGDSIKAAADYEKTITSLRGVVDATGRDINQVYAEMEKQIGGLASRAQVASGFLKGMTTTLSVEQIANLTTAIKNASIAMGEDFNVQLPLIIKAVKQLNPAILDNIGVTVRLDQVNKKIRDGYYGAGTAINEYTQQNAIYQEIIKQTMIYQGQEEKLLGTVAGKWQALNVALEDAKKAFGDWLADAEDGKGVLNFTTELLRNLANYLESDITWVEQLTLKFALMTGDLETANDILLKFDASGKRIGNTVDRLPALPAHLTESQREALRIAKAWEDKLAQSRQRIQELSRAMSAGNFKAFEDEEARRLESGEDSFDDFYSQKVFDGARERLNEATALYQLHNQLRLEMATGLDRDLEQIEQTRLARIEIINASTVLSEAQKTAEIVKINAAANAAMERASAALAAAEKEKAKAVANAAGQAFGQIADAFRALNNDMEDGWARMADAFLNLFLNVILAEVGPGGQFIRGFLNAFKFWDIPANDRALIREGRRAAMFIRQGVDEGLSGFAPNLLPYKPNADYGIERQPTQIVVNFSGPVTNKRFITQEIIPEIEKAISRGRTRIATSKPLLTGSSEVRVN